MTITQVGTLFVPVTDQERSLAFFVDVLGFEKRTDFVYGAGSRWVEVAPPGSPSAIALVPPDEGSSRGDDEARCAFVSGDIAADHAALVAAGVDVDERIAGTGVPRRGLISPVASVPDPVPSQFFFRDPDGNRFLIVG